MGTVVDYIGYIDKVDLEKTSKDELVKVWLYKDFSKKKFTFRGNYYEELDFSCEAAIRFSERVIFPSFRLAAQTTATIQI